MTKEEALLWLVALDYAACEAPGLDEREFLSEWWTAFRDGSLWSLSCLAGVHGLSS